MMRKPFGVRFSEAEMQELRLKAQLRGWSVGRYIRWCSLGHELNQEQRIAKLEKQLRELGTKK